MTERSHDPQPAEDAVETVMEDATEDLVVPPQEPDEDGPEAPTVDSGGGPQQGAAEDRGV